MRLVVGSRALALVLLICIALVACTATRGRRGAPEESGFLRDYSMLKHRDDYPASLIYIRSGVDFSQYDRIEIDSVTLWRSEATAALTPDEQQMLTDTLYTALHEELGHTFPITDQPGPSTLRIRAALTQAKGANRASRILTTVMPQARLLSTVASLSTDAAVTVGTATAEVEVLDAITGQRLAASVDERAGNKALFTGRTFSKWGDIEAACRFWARRIAYYAAKEGVRRKPGAPMPERPEGPRTL
jgi:hypothetical protein